MAPRNDEEIELRQRLLAMQFERDDALRQLNELRGEVEALRAVVADVQPQPAPRRVRAVPAPIAESAPVAEPGPPALPAAEPEPRLQPVVEATPDPPEPAPEPPEPVAELAAERPEPVGEATPDPPEPKVPSSTPPAPESAGAPRPRRGLRRPRGSKAGPVVCAITGERAPTASVEELRLAGWIVHDQGALSPAAKAEGWRLLDGATVPFKSLTDRG